MEQKYLCSFELGHYGVHSCEVIWNLDKWFRMRCHLKTFYLEFCQPVSSADQNYLCNVGRRYHKERFCEIILNLDQWFRRKCRLKISLIWSSCMHFVRRSVTICAIYGRGYYEEQFCEIILNLGQWFRRRCHLNDF